VVPLADAFLCYHHAVGKVPTFEELLRDPKARETLNLAQLYEFTQRLKGLTKGLGARGRIEVDPADFAARLSAGRWHHAIHLDFLSQKLQALHKRKIRRLMVSMPPRHGKSLMLDVYLPLWWLAQHPEDSVILASYGETFARGFGGKVRDLVIEHGDSLNLVVNKDKTAADDWQLTTGGGMVCVGVGGSITGRGANLLVIDDPVKNEEEAMSPTYREKMWDWWQATSQTRLEPNAVVVIVATRWHQDDLLGRIEDSDEENDWEIIRLPALAEDNDPLGRAKDEPLWPERFFDDPLYESKQRNMSPYWWSALYQQRPTPEGGGIIKRDDFEFFHTQPEMFDQMMQSWDLALKDNQTNDYSVGQVWGRKGANLYLLNQVRGHYSLSKIQTYMKQFAAQYPQALAKIVEDSAMGPAIKQTLTHEVPGIIPFTAKGTKRSRLDAIEPVFRSHNIFVPTREDGSTPRWVWDFIEELVQFPKGANDDQVDAATQAVSHMLPSGWAQLAREAKQKEEGEEITPAELRASYFSQKFAQMRKGKPKRDRGLRTANW
jgi:predicted phage terminase large subunit-like protein